MNTFNKVKKLACGFVFSFAFLTATASIGLFCITGLMEEPEAPKSLLNR